MSQWSEYLTHGWQLCAIPPGTKGPRTPGWNLKGAAFNANAMSAGLCHAYSGTCAVDFDDLKRALAGLDKDGIDLDWDASENVRIVSGRPNRDKLLFRITEPLPSISLYPYEVEDPETKKPKKYHALELRCGTDKGTSVQDVLPPSIHPNTGKPYEWAYGDDLTGTWANLPPLPAALEALWRAQLAPVADMPVIGQISASGGAGSPELEAFLATRDPNCDHDEWVEVGMVLHHETRGSAAGLALYDNWSRKGSKYGESKDGKPAQFPADKWRSFKLDTPNQKTIGEFRREQVADASDFPVVAAPVAGKVADDGLDAIKPTRPDEVGRVIAYVRDQAKFVDLRDNLVYKNVEAVATTFGPSMRLTKKGAKPNLEAYLKNARVAGNNADHFGMHPGMGRFYNEGSKRYLNMFKPHVVEPIRPTPGARLAFEFLWGRIVDKEFARWFKQFYAYAIKHPGRKIRSAPLLISETTGTGKGTITTTIPSLLFGKVEQFSDASLKGQFNGQLVNSWWVTFDEIHVGDTKAQRKAIIDKIKPWITNDRIEIRPMYGAGYTMANHIQFTASSNRLDALHIDDKDERRWGVGRLTERKLTSGEVRGLFNTSGDPSTRGYLVRPESASWLRAWFEETDLSDFDPDGKPPVTPIKAAMATTSLGTWETRILEAMAERRAPFDRDVFTIGTLRDNLFTSGYTSNAQLGVILNSNGFRSFVDMKRGGPTGEKIYIWRNVRRWAARPFRALQEHLQTGEFPGGAAAWNCPLPEQVAAHAGHGGGVVECDSEHEDLL
jgi:hypothetical protein